MTESEIITFAKSYDPQPFHTQINPPKYAAHHELIASGWHTCAVTMRLIVENMIDDETTLPSPGIDELRFLRPVKPGDRLSVRFTVTDVRLSKTKPDRGVMLSKTETLNQKGEVVLSFTSIAFLRRRTR